MSVSPATRKFVFQRAFYICEYCLLHESDSYFPLQVEHIISQKHKGSDEIVNLACACSICNRAKGSDLSTVLHPNLEVVRLFRPRNDRWLDHFEISGNLFLPKTNIGQATVQILELNAPEKIEERAVLIKKGRFPHPNVFLLWGSQ